MAAEFSENGIEWDFSKLTLDDLVQYGEAENLRKRLPFIAKAIKSTEKGINLNDPKDWKKLTLTEWANIWKEFQSLMDATFQ